MPKGASSPVPGDRYGKWTIVERHASGTSKHPKYQVRCECGTVSVIGWGSLSKAVSNDGGCRSCATFGQPRKYGDRTIVGNPLYRIWAGMRHRCNPEATTADTDNARWAGRGISVCEEWHSFPVFEAWALANGYKPGLTIDRVENDGNYEPSNCEWVTRSVNSKRMRALYRMVPVKNLPAPVVVYAYRYDEPTYGDY